MKKDHMIVYAESSDEIHIALTDWKTFKEMEDLYEEYKNDDRGLGDALIDKFSDLYSRGLIEKSFTQTYCCGSPDIRIDGPIQRIMHIPMY